jgi:hypothetical protein
MTTKTETRVGHTPGPLEQLQAKMADHCQMCGTTKDYLEPAFNPSGKPMTLCRDCRIGSAEPLDEARARMLEALEHIIEIRNERDKILMIAEAAIRLVKGEQL